MRQTVRILCLCFQVSALGQSFSVGVIMWRRAGRDVPRERCITRMVVRGDRRHLRGSGPEGAPQKGGSEKGGSPSASHSLSPSPERRPWSTAALFFSEGTASARSSRGGPWHAPGTRGASTAAARSRCRRRRASTRSTCTSGLQGPAEVWDNAVAGQGWRTHRPEMMVT